MRFISSMSSIECLVGSENMSVLDEMKFEKINGYRLPVLIDAEQPSSGDKLKDRKSVRLMLFTGECTHPK